MQPKLAQPTEKRKGTFFNRPLPHFFRLRCQLEAGAISKRIPASLNLHIFYPDYYDRAGLKLLSRAVSNQCSFSERIHWFCVDGRLIYVKKCAVLKISGFVWN